MKRVLWGLVIIIVPAFVLVGSITSFQNRDQNTIAVFNKKKIKTEDFQKFLSTAQLYLLFNFPDPGKVSNSDMYMLAIDFMILLDKAKQEGIAVNDEQVIAYIRNHPITSQFFIDGSFQNEYYQGFLQRISQRQRIPLTPRIFEDHVRNFLTITMLIDKNSSVTISEEEIRNLYARETQKAKIAYLFVPYEKFKAEIGVSKGELTDFYQQNSEMFMRPEAVKLQYVLIEKDNDDLDEIGELASRSVKLSEVAAKFSLQIRETNFIGINDPLEGIGWQPQISALAFALEEGAISQPIDTPKKVVIFQKIGQRPESLPAFDEIQDQVKNAYVTDKAKQDTQRFTEELLLKVNKESPLQLSSFTQENLVEYKETGYFGYADYVDGLGLDESVNDIIFSLDDRQLHPKPLLLANGAYLVQLLEKTPIDEAQLKEKYDTYVLKLRQAKEITAKEGFIYSLRRQADISFLRPLPE